MKLPLFIFSIFCVVHISCDNNFQPLVEDHSTYFSVYGVLDASADTNWIRISPVRESILTKPDSIDANVTVTEISSGEKFKLNAQLFNPRPDYYAWNFWTTADIKTGAEYLFEVKNSDGETSRAEVYIPEDFPTPTVRYTEGPSARIEVKDVNILAVARVFYYFHANYRGQTSPVYRDSFSQLSDVREAAGGVVVYAYPEADKAAITRTNSGDNIQVIHLWQEVQIVSGGPAWPIFDSLIEGEDLLPQTKSNIQNGVGVLAGVLSKAVPLKSCYDENENLIACPLLDPITPWE